MKVVEFYLAKHPNGLLELRVVGKAPTFAFIMLGTVISKIVEYFPFR